MGNTPRKTQVSQLTNDVISSIKLNPDYDQTITKKRGRTFKPNAYRLDELVILIKAHAGIATGDYLIAEVDYSDLNGKALADLLNPSNKDYIERQGKIWEILGTNGPTVEDVDPAKIPISLKFDHCYITQDEAYINLLCHGLAAARDTEVEVWGQYVELGQTMYDKLDKSSSL